MSEKKTRTMEEVAQDYSNTCAKVGHMQFQMNQLQKDISILYSQLNDLSIEGLKLQAEKPAAPSNGHAASLSPESGAV